MKRKKMEETPESKDFWPVPGVDGEPYPPLVQDALDLVEKETLRRKRAECTHANRKFITGSGQDRYGMRIGYRRACRDCGLVVSCEHPEYAQRRDSVKYIGPGSYVEFWDCRCGERIAKRLKPERKTGTDWLKTAEEERREARRDGMVSRQIRRAAERGFSDLDRDLQECLERGPYRQGALAHNTESFVLRNANGEMVLQMSEEEDRAPDLSWVRTMNGRKYLR